ncbi:deoxyribose-phosphate aldolase [Aurantimonas sp. Leaf443]|uniref:deoxyribose-phosphate aldolase n=1 Tax=Aurantimonas sp. Leaf443 TaxID=1736378 RepID=UPI0006F906F8|nr:deoxyribose-phosphate aldolase [Aurantimonas sp. Leaf443]KQT83050.1 2-deoxyribose-5-phosphate aldolase [Aurantimonas sp. Leaf443]
MTDDPAAKARRLIACLDLTDLSDTSSQADVAALCERAVTPEGRVAAICIWPRFVAFAAERLDPAIRIATVVNFPAGEDDVAATCDETRRAVADGAHEIDLVIAHSRLPVDPGFVTAQVAAVKDACGGALLKTILETGELADAATIRLACRAALEGGADFLKTSTGKRPVAATPASARLLMEAAAGAGRPVGVKPAGGIRSFEDAAAYADLAEAILGPGGATPARFRLGASGVLADLLAVARGERRPAAGAAY